MQRRTSQGEWHSNESRPSDTNCGASGLMTFDEAPSHPDTSVRRSAVELLGTIGAAATELLPALVRSAVVDRDRGVNYAALAAIDRIEAPPEQLVILYVELLTTLPRNDPDDTKRLQERWGRSPRRPQRVFPPSSALSRTFTHSCGSTPSSPLARSVQPRQQRCPR